MVLGISPDTPKKHRKFREKYGLPYTLIADVDHSIAEQYGVWGEKKFMGRTYMGIKRTTFVIGKDGTIIRVFEDVTPKGHGADVAEAIAESEA